MTPLNELEPRFKGPMRMTKVKKNSVWVKCLVTEKIYKVHSNRIKLAGELHDTQLEVFPTKEIVLDNAHLVSEAKESIVSKPRSQGNRIAPETFSIDEPAPETVEPPEDDIREARTDPKATTDAQPMMNRYSLRSRKGTVENYDNVMHRPIEFRKNHLIPQEQS